LEKNDFLSVCIRLEVDMNDPVRLIHRWSTLFATEAASTKCVVDPQAILLTSAFDLTGNFEMELKAYMPFAWAPKRRAPLKFNRRNVGFSSKNISDGTLRALGVLTALFQSSNGGPKKVPFVGIEEPEVAVHPGAAGVLRDGLRAASKTTQIAVTRGNLTSIGDVLISSRKAEGPEYFFGSKAD
jgi:hypothetical protein